MGSFSEGEESQFFDAYQDILSVVEEKSDDTDTSDGNFNCNTGIFNRSEYEEWIQCPRSVKERRIKFMKLMGLSLDRIALENSLDVCSIDREEIDRIKDTSEVVTRTSGFEEVQEEFCSSHSLMSCWSTLNSSKELGSVEKLSCEEGVLDEKIRFSGGQEEQYGKVSDGRELGLDQLVVAEEHEDFEGSSVSSPSPQHMMGREFMEAHVSSGIMKRARRHWISKLRSLTCMLDRQADNGREDGCFEFSGHRVQKVKVHQCKKHTKELSALYTGQEIQAHEGSILTMKFSPDGKYLASAGEDGIVRLWLVVEDQRCDEIDIPEIDPSCIYFTVNHFSELTPMFMDKEKTSKMSLKKTSDSACVVFPPKVFRLLEKPLHVFHGHRGDILNLSWSKNNYLLSSSVDKTVRLWRVGYDDCLKVFPHNNYVTCVQFNPVDDNHFISGSIDGKVRIWSIPECQVVNWTHIREIVTAVCYQPDGQGGIIGSITGNCRLFNISENHLQLDAQQCLLSKKRSQSGGITGFQFLPQDSSRVMVTCADSQVRILEGLNVISKYKSIGSGSLMSAYFTSDGKHILSTSEDSNVYLWNVTEGGSSPQKVNKIKSSERFLSNASVAVPWCGLKSQNTEIEHQMNVLEQRSPQFLCLSPPASFSLGEEFFLESFSKGSATWPEEKLPTSTPNSKTSSMHKSEFKFLKSCCKSTSNSHAWGLVIVTATRDGRIRSFHNYGLPVPI